LCIRCGMGVQLVLFQLVLDCLRAIKLALSCIEFLLCRVAVNACQLSGSRKEERSVVRSTALWANEPERSSQSTANVQDR